MYVVRYLAEREGKLCHAARNVLCKPYILTQPTLTVLLVGRPPPPRNHFYHSVQACPYLTALFRRRIASRCALCRAMQCALMHDVCTMHLCCHATTALSNAFRCQDNLSCGHVYALHHFMQASEQRAFVPVHETKTASVYQLGIASILSDLPTSTRDNVHA